MKGSAQTSVCNPEKHIKIPTFNFNDKLVFLHPFFFFWKRRVLKCRDKSVLKCYLSCTREYSFTHNNDNNYTQYYVAKSLPLPGSEPQLSSP